MTVTEPLDRTHADSVLAVELIRQAFTVARADAARWTPTPCPSQPAQGRQGLRR